MSMALDFMDKALFCWLKLTKWWSKVAHQVKWWIQGSGWLSEPCACRSNLSAQLPLRIQHGEGGSWEDTILGDLNAFGLDWSCLYYFTCLGFGSFPNHVGSALPGLSSFPLMDKTKKMKSWVFLPSHCHLFTLYISLQLCSYILLCSGS